jgi:hypothetical protein
MVTVSDFSRITACRDKERHDVELEEWLRRENGGAWGGGASTHARRIGKQNEPSYLSLVIPQKQHAARRIGKSWEQGFKYDPPSSSFLGGGD